MLQCEKWATPPQEILSNECVKKKQGLGGESLSGFNLPLSVRLIKDIISPHKPSSAQEILERALLWVKAWYPQCWQLWVCISNQTTDRWFLSPYFQVLNAKSSALPSRLSCPAQPAPCYWFSLQAATHPRKPKQWHHWKTEVREGTSGAGGSYTPSCWHHKTDGPVIMAGHTA